MNKVIELYVNDLIQDKDAVKLIQYVTNKNEGQRDVDNLRCASHMFALRSSDYISRSPEDILLDEERTYMILRFLDWIHSILPSTDWYIFVLYVFGNMNYAYVGRKLGMGKYSASRLVKRILRDINNMIPYYDMDIKEYLKE